MRKSSHSAKPNPKSRSTGILKLNKKKKKFKKVRFIDKPQVFEEEAWRKEIKKNLIKAKKDKKKCRIF